MTTIGFARLILLWAVNRNFLYYVMMERFSEICGTVMYFSYVKQCWNLAIFYPILLYVNSILAYFKRSKSIILTILEALNFDFWEFYSWKCQKFKIHSCSDGHDSSFLVLQNDQTLFHVKSEWLKNPEIFTLYRRLEIPNYLFTI